jgi:two-component system chemotaxis response regulator CheY
MPIIKVQERPAPQGTRDGEFTVHPGASQGGPGCLRGAAPVSPGDAARPELRPRTGARGGATVLIVDDSPSIRRRVRAALEDGGHAVLEAADGATALALLELNRADLVITDMNMDVMTGLELVTRIRAQHSRQALPVLFLTTEAGDDMKSRGRAVGADGWLVKPADANRLREVVGYVLRRGRA